jgi:hypothetical protein
MHIYIFIHIDIDLNLQKIVGNFAVIMALIFGGGLLGLSKSDASTLAVALPLLEKLVALGVTTQYLTMIGTGIIVCSIFALTKPKVRELVCVYLCMNVYVET